MQLQAQTQIPHIEIVSSQASAFSVIKIFNNSRLNSPIEYDSIASRCLVSHLPSKSGAMMTNMKHRNWRAQNVSHPYE